jgi:predicted PilT family ATPase
MLRSRTVDAVLWSARVISDQVASQLLLSLDGFEERLEVTGTKAVKVVALDDFDEDSRAVQHMLRTKKSVFYSGPRSSVPLTLVNNCRR